MNLAGSSDSETQRHHYEPDRRPAPDDQQPPSDPVAFWEEKYGRSDQVWSGRANQSLVDVVAELTPGRALDLGCGEGGDTIWLAERGWQVTAVDISATAVARARLAADRAGIDPDRIRWQVADLDTWVEPDRGYDLVAACFFHSPVAHDRTGTLRRGAEGLRRDGRLVIVSHAELPPWAGDDPQHSHAEHTFLSPEEEVAALGLDEQDWAVERAERRIRNVVAPDGSAAHLIDVVVVVTRST